jgi:hypothetical protein
MLLPKPTLVPLPRRRRVFYISRGQPVFSALLKSLELRAIIKVEDSAVTGEYQLSGCRSPQT